MNTLLGLKEEQIKKIYNHTTLLSEKKYHLLSKEDKKVIEWKYIHALDLIKKMNLKESYNNESEEFLISQKKIIDEIRKKNKPIIDNMVKQVIAILKEEMPEHLSYIEKVEYIFDCVTNLITYSERWNMYCYKLPPLEEYNFDFNKGIPISEDFKDILVLRTGMCEQIARLLVYLGEELGAKIYIEKYLYNNNKHAINYIYYNDEKLYMNATSVIRKRTKKADSFLRHREELDSKNKCKNRKVKYDLDAIIKKINSIPFHVQYWKE